jgi:hypothetical protein
MVCMCNNGVGKSKTIFQCLLLVFILYTRITHTTMARIVDDDDDKQIMRPYMIALIFIFIERILL